MSPADVGELARAAARGDDTAWAALVERFSGLIWAIARGHGLCGADAADVSQTTWLRLAEHIAALREPEKVGAWLATTARNESVNVLRRRARHVPCGNEKEFPADAASDAARSVLERERESALWKAFKALPTRCQTLLRVLTADPAPSYAEVSAVLGMPIGSIGPTRGRCIENLRRRGRGIGEDDRRWAAVGGR